MYGARREVFLAACDDFPKILDEEHVGVSDEGNANSDGTRGDSGERQNDREREERRR